MDLILFSFVIHYHHWTHGEVAENSLRFWLKNSWITRGIHVVCLVGYSNKRWFRLHSQKDWLIQWLNLIQRGTCQRVSVDWCSLHSRGDLMEPKGYELNQWDCLIDPAENVGSLKALLSLIWPFRNDHRQSYCWRLLKTYPRRHGPDFYPQGTHLSGLEGVISWHVMKYHDISW